MTVKSCAECTDRVDTILQKIQKSCSSVCTGEYCNAYAECSMITGTHPTMWDIGLLRTIPGVKKYPAAYGNRVKYGGCSCGFTWIQEKAEHPVICPCPLGTELSIIEGGTK